MENLQKLNKKMKRGKIKKEILSAIQGITIEYENTSFNYEGNEWESERFEHQIKSKNYWIDLKFDVIVRFIDLNEFKFDSIDVIEFNIFDFLGNDIDVKITNKELIKNINNQL